jgi:dGTP triphosphohydrolase
MTDEARWYEFELIGRAAQEAAEAGRLAPWATPSNEGRRRDEAEGTDVLRPEFQRDRDRILHSRAFRRLKHKTQVFVPHTADHPRTRLTHTLEVAQIGRTIARALAVNEDLVEAIGLGHDLGHTAFGHTGETVLRDILSGRVPEIGLSDEALDGAGTFKHNYQSVRVVDLLERRYAHPGLGLTDQVREGILKHTGWRADLDFPLPDVEGLNLGGPCHVEGQVVAVADEMSPTLVWFSPEVEEDFAELKRFIYQFIINHAQVNRQDWRARKVMTALFHAFWSNPLTLPSYVLLRAREELGFPYLRDVPLPAVASEIAARYHASPGFVRLVVDHLAGMSDRFALEEYRSLEQPTPDQRFTGDLR